LPLDPADLDWTDDGAPRSKRFGDIYFSREGGLDETRAVFLQGCGLPGAWQGRSHFTVGELGFGTGLNILALLKLWARTRTPGQTLSVFSIEAYPLPREDAARALSAWPELGALSQPLLGVWPRRAPGFHRVSWPESGVTLDLAQGEALWALEQWTGAADAWFLDGFSPALNPGMWREEVLAAVTARTAPGAVLATFTVAGAVRRGLQAAGFAVDKRPGHGAKRERLEARFAGEPGPASPLPTVAVIGAGIAGASLVRALTALGLDPVVVEAEGRGAGASGNPAALVTPALDAGGGARARLYAQAFSRAVDLYRAVGPAVVANEGVIQLQSGERDGARFDTVAAGDVFEPGALVRLTPAQATAALGYPAQVGAVRFTEGLVIRPPALLDVWLGGARRLHAHVASLRRREGDGWTLLDEEGHALLAADVVCVAAGAQVDALLDQPLPLLPVRGQASWAEGLDLPTAVVWGGYAAPFDGGLLFGATHDRGRTDTGTDPADHERNLDILAQALPAVAQSARLIPVQGRASIRAAAHDRMPVAGAVGDGLYVLGGLGSRGFTTAPLLAEHLAALIAGTPSPMPRDLQSTVEPSRLRKK
jgi:tRNA 5-methylaminomethyl-2-thiouridine biosynthesis bifunctional protein